ncbi:HAD-IIB family hydrolase [Mycoplasma sp. SG1]|uniref:HAD-IIB family hydrolase n=1 Tax=Mycoplasma sp. SG1 TaxID=2810348 RepID=UPI002024252F|nr:HAD-IIB family hydrolase [Mycoplasma sp. SG1]URM52762.1 HAD family hydrolase [Mycoplasma sp. SG1]
MVYKFFCIDLDGTLLNRKLKISIKNKYACNNLMKSGTSILITTGRNEASTVFFANSLNLFQPKFNNYWVAYNGALVYDCKNNVYLLEKPFKKINILKKFIQVLYQNKFLFVIGIKNKSLSNISCSFLKKRIKKYYFHDLIKFNITEFNDDTKCFKLSIFSKNLFCGFSKKSIQIIKNLTESLNLDYQFVFQKRIIEVTPKGVSKKTAVEFLCQTKNILPLTQVAAIGDSENDYDLLIYSGFKACPRNAVKKIKEIADVVSTKSAGQSAVADVINNHILNT